MGMCVSTLWLLRQHGLHLNSLLGTGSLNRNWFADVDAHLMIRYHRAEKKKKEAV